MKTIKCSIFLMGMAIVQTGCGVSNEKLAQNQQTMGQNQNRLHASVTAGNQAGTADRQQLQANQQTILNEVRDQKSSGSNSLDFYREEFEHRINGVAGRALLDGALKAEVGVATANAEGWVAMYGSSRLNRQPALNLSGNAQYFQVTPQAGKVIFDPVRGSTNGQLPPLVQRAIEENQETLEQLRKENAGLRGGSTTVTPPTSGSGVPPAVSAPPAGGGASS